MRGLSILVLGAGLALPVLAQRGGSFSPDESFNRLLQSYNGSGDTIDFARVSPEARERYDRFAQMTSSERMPASGSISRVEYADVFNKRMEAMRGGGGFNRGGGDKGPGGNNRGAAVPLTPPVPGAPPVAPPERLVSDEDVAKMMRRLDKNDDGRLTWEEAQSTDRLKHVFENYDTNKDRVIDLAEMRGYTADRINNRVPDPPRGDNQNPSGGPQNYPPPNYSGTDSGRGGSGSVTATAEEERPVVLRFGKLPMKELPSWFETLDTDKDGQIGLYEWRAGKRITAEYLAMDLNNDGLLPAEEYLRWKKVPSGSGPVVSLGENAARGGKDAKDGKDPKDNKDNNKENKKEERRNNGNNPFRK